MQVGQDPDAPTNIENYSWCPLVLTHCTRIGAGENRLSKAAPFKDRRVNSHTKTTFHKCVYLSWVATGVKIQEDPGSSPKLKNDGMPPVLPGPKCRTESSPNSFFSSPFFDSLGGSLPPSWLRITQWGPDGIRWWCRIQCFRDIWRSTGSWL